MPTHRHAAGFGKRIELYVIGRMLKEGLDVYIPLVDDNAVDAVVKKPNGQFVEIQIKARSADCLEGDAAPFFWPYASASAELLVCLLLGADGFDLDYVVGGVRARVEREQDWQEHGQANNLVQRQT